MRKTGYDNKEFELVNENLDPVLLDSEVILSRGDERILTKVDDAVPPHKPASTGRVYLRSQLADGSWTQGSFAVFPNVVKMKWVEVSPPKPTRRSLSAIIKDIIHEVTLLRARPGRQPPLWIVYSMPYLEYFKDYEDLSQMHEDLCGEMELMRLLGNLQTWRGETAQKIKEELHQHLRKGT